MIRLIATDMDGTFLDEKGLYDRERFAAVLDELEQRQIPFVVATGNNLSRLSLMFEGFLDRIALVADNGSHVIDRGTELVRRTMDRSLVFEFLAFLGNKLSDYRVSVSTASGIYLHEGTHFPTDSFAIDPKEMASFVSRLKYLEDFAQLPDEPILKVGMLLPADVCESVMAAVNAQFSGRLTATTSGYGSVDVIETGLHKAWGLQQLMDKWGITSDQVMAFGDGGNDIELLRLAGHSYAVTNAPEDVQAAARYLAPSHREAGVLTVIEREVLGKA